MYNSSDAPLMPDRAPHIERIDSIHLNLTCGDGSKGVCGRSQCEMRCSCDNSSWYCTECLKEGSWVAASFCCNTCRALQICDECADRHVKSCALSCGNRVENASPLGFNSNSTPYPNYIYSGSPNPRNPVIHDWGSITPPQTTSPLYERSAKCVPIEEEVWRRYSPASAPCEGQQIHPTYDRLTPETVGAESPLPTSPSSSGPDITEIEDLERHAMEMKNQGVGIEWCQLKLKTGYPCCYLGQDAEHAGNSHIWARCLPLRPWANGEDLPNVQMACALYDGKGGLPENVYAESLKFGDLSPIFKQHLLPALDYTLSMPDPRWYEEIGFQAILFLGNLKLGDKVARTLVNVRDGLILVNATHLMQEAEQTPDLAFYIVERLSRIWHEFGHLGHQKILLGGEEAVDWAIKAIMPTHCFPSEGQPMNLSPQNRLKLPNQRVYCGLHPKEIRSDAFADIVLSRGSVRPEQLALKGIWIEGTRATLPHTHELMRRDYFSRKGCPPWLDEALNNYAKGHHIETTLLSEALTRLSLSRFLPAYPQQQQSEEKANEEKPLPPREAIVPSWATVRWVVGEPVSAENYANSEIMAAEPLIECDHLPPITPRSSPKTVLDVHEGSTTPPDETEPKDATPYALDAPDLTSGGLDGPAAAVSKQNTTPSGKNSKAKRNVVAAARRVGSPPEATSASKQAQKSRTSMQERKPYQGKNKVHHGQANQIERQDKTDDDIVTDQRVKPVLSPYPGATSKEQALRWEEKWLFHLFFHVYCSPQRTREELPHQIFVKFTARGSTSVMVDLTESSALSVYRATCALIGHCRSNCDWRLVDGKIQASLEDKTTAFDRGMRQGGSYTLVGRMRAGMIQPTNEDELEGPDEEETTAPRPVSPTPRSPVDRFFDMFSSNEGESSSSPLVTTHPITTSLPYEPFLTAVQEDSQTEIVRLVAEGLKPSTELVNQPKEEPESTPVKEAVSDPMFLIITGLAEKMERLHESQSRQHDELCRMQRQPPPLIPTVAPSEVAQLQASVVALSHQVRSLTSLKEQKGRNSPWKYTSTWNGSFGRIASRGARARGAYYATDQL